MKKFLPSLVGALALFFVSTAAFANDYVKFKGWKQAETTHFRFIYEDASEQAAQKYAEFADEAWEKIARIYAMPQEKTDVYVFSRLNIVNAYTMFTPPEIVMFDSPLIDNYFGFRDDWMKLFFTHELIHIANINFEDKNYLATKLLGESIRGMDYSSIPGWALEGLTTVLETELTNGGRGRSPYFELSLKAPTLDNNFIPYRLVGTEQEPPYSQIYVMGYLIMRSIADRWGLQALADIERNRNIDCTWEQSVKLVTGHTPQDIYREAKIALEKKYADERKIPEGKIISPNDLNVNYYKPAIVLDDGSIVTRRADFSSSAIVLLNPSAKDGMKFVQDSGNVKETILFRGASEITSDENLNIYYTTAISRYDRAPYNETQFALYKWSKDEDGNITDQPLTHDQSSYYQPAVSRDGKVLVAVEQKGLKMRIVRVDLQTGDVTPLFQDEQYSFIQPALNADGSKIAFVLLKEDRACIALGDMTTGQYKIVTNTEHDFITDPSSPEFNKDGTLTFCSNDRGRLEIYEAVPNSDGQTFTCTPKLSDPVGALWAYKNDMAVFYASEASTGSVIKIKPLEEWGNIADFEGPSPAGEIMTFGPLSNDYPDFDPYTKLAEAKTEKAEDEDAQSADTSSSDTDKKPENDPVKHRSQKAIEKLENLEGATPELTNIKGFRPYITPILYLPFVNTIDAPEKTYLGFGGMFAGLLPRLQMRQGVIYADAFYYPGIKNFTGEFVMETPLFSGALDILLSRNSSWFELAKDKSRFTLQNNLILGYTMPVYSREQYSLGRELDILAYTGVTFKQESDHAFSLLEKLPFSKDINYQAGLSYIQTANLPKDQKLQFNITNLALGEWNFDKNKMFIGYEGEFSVSYGNTTGSQEAGLVVRYTDFASDTVPQMSRAHFLGQAENCLFPGKLLLNYTYTIPSFFFGMADGSFSAQGLASFGNNHTDKNTPSTGLPMNLQIEKKINLGMEARFNLGATQKLGIGYAALLDLGNNTKTTWNFYVTAKLNWIRF
ncbi:MAG: hypothetical protein J5726_10555 [Treponema sp.]|nr:hypothetical protein [Treponema sp.]